MDIIPSIYNTEEIGASPFYSGGAFNNIKLHQGEVRRIIYPNDAASVSKMFVEYDVLVYQQEMGTYAGKIYRNCTLINSIAGGADQSTWTLRASTQPVENLQESDGSRVVILCVEGSNNQPIILGGLRDERCAKDLSGQHFLNWEFNGVNFKINDDGSWSIVNKGKTTNLGEVDPKANKDGIGTTIKTEANGNITINTPDNNQSIVIDNEKNTITINGDREVTVNGSRINLGKDANEPQVLGRQLVLILTELVAAISTMTMYTFGVPGTVTSVPLNVNLFASIAARLEFILSRQSFVKMQ